MKISPVQQSLHTSILFQDSFLAYVITEYWVEFSVLIQHLPVGRSLHITQCAYANLKPPVHPSRLPNLSTWLNIIFSKSVSLISVLQISSFVSFFKFFKNFILFYFFNPRLDILKWKGSPSKMYLWLQLKVRKMAIKQDACTTLKEERKDDFGSTCERRLLGKNKCCLLLGTMISSTLLLDLKGDKWQTINWLLHTDIYLPNLW